MNVNEAKDDPVLKAAQQFRDTLVKMGYKNPYVFVAHDNDDFGNILHVSALPIGWTLPAVSVRLACITASVVQLNRKNVKRDGEGPDDFYHAF